MINISPPQSPSPATSPALEARILSHKVHLSSKYAFLFCQDVVNGVKNNSFSVPPKRHLHPEELDHKLEAEASTSAGSEYSLESTSRLEPAVLKPPVPETQSQRSQVVAQALAKVVEFEEFLQTSKLASQEAAATAGRLHRESLKRLEEDGFAARDATETAFAVMVFASERAEIDKEALKKFAESMLGARRANQMDKVRKVRAYTLLASQANKGNLRSF